MQSERASTTPLMPLWFQKEERNQYEKIFVSDIWHMDAIWQLFGQRVFFYLHVRSDANPYHEPKLKADE